MVEREKVNKAITWSIKILLSALFVFITLAVIGLEGTKKPQEEIDETLNQQRAAMRAILAGKDITKKDKPEGARAFHWPPKMNQPYPDLILIDRNNREFRLSDMKDFVIVVSYVDMSSPISQAQAGASVAGAFGTTSEVDKYAEPFSKMVAKNAPNGFKLPNDGVLEVNVLVYKQDGGQPTLGDADEWAEHFGLSLERGVIVAVPKHDIRGNAAQSILTGYQLVDQHMMLRVDSAGPEPKHNLGLTLVPMLSKLAL